MDKSNINRLKNDNVKLLDLNMTNDEIAALCELTYNYDLTKPADKGGAIVIDTVEYAAEANRQLADVSVYRVLPRV